MIVFSMVVLNNDRLRFRDSGRDLILFVGTYRLIIVHCC